MWEQLKTGVFPGITPDLVREWFSLNNDDDSLAEAIMNVSNLTGRLHHSINEYEDIWLDAVYYDWQELEEELVQECIGRLEKRNILPDVKGWVYQVKPFMSEHGYECQYGWWRKTETNQTIIKEGSNDS